MFLKPRCAERENDHGVNPRDSCDPRFPVLRLSSRKRTISLPSCGTLLRTGCAMKVRTAMAACIAGAFPLAAESQGSVAGRVVADSTRIPVASVELIIAGTTARAVTDSAGRFVLRGVPGGRRFLVARAPGFHPDTSPVELFDNESLSREIVLKRRITTLGEVNIRDSTPALMPAKMREFTERRRASVGGQFVDSAVIAKWENRRTGDLFSTLSGVDVRRGGSAAYLSGSRAPPSISAGVSSSRTPPCFMDIYLDGAPVALGNKAFDVNSVGLNHIAAIEVYSGPANTPPQYNRTSNGCGVVLIWTK